VAKHAQAIAGYVNTTTTTAPLVRGLGDAMETLRSGLLKPDAQSAWLQGTSVLKVCLPLPLPCLCLFLSLLVFIDIYFLCHLLSPPSPPDRAKDLNTWLQEFTATTGAEADDELELELRGNKVSCTTVNVRALAALAAAKAESIALGEKIRAWALATAAHVSPFARG
jgi:hypothetical protein